MTCRQPLALLLLATISLLCGGGNAEEPVKPQLEVYFRLTNKFLEGKRYFDVYGTEPYAPHMAEAGEPPTSGQKWKFEPLKEHPGYFRMTNSFLEGKYYLDVTGDTYQPHMAEAGDTITTGQMWKFVPLKDNPGYLRLTNKFLEGKRYLDTYNNENFDFYMAEAGDTVLTGQMWKLVPVKQ